MNLFRRLLLFKSRVVAWTGVSVVIVCAICYKHHYNDDGGNLVPNVYGLMDHVYRQNPLALMMPFSAS